MCLLAPPHRAKAETATGYHQHQKNTINKSGVFRTWKKKFQEKYVE